MKVVCSGGVSVIWSWVPLFLVGGAKGPDVPALTPQGVMGEKDGTVRAPAVDGFFPVSASVCPL